jgi:hypothetical protein
LFGSMVNMGDARFYWQISRISAIALKLIFLNYYCWTNPSSSAKITGKMQYNDASTLRWKGGGHRHQDRLESNNDGSDLLVH